MWKFDPGNNNFMRFFSLFLQFSCSYFFGPYFTSNRFTMSAAISWVWPSPLDFPVWIFVYQSDFTFFCSQKDLDRNQSAWESSLCEAATFMVPAWTWGCIVWRHVVSVVWFLVDLLTLLPPVFIQLNSNIKRASIVVRGYKK